MIAGIMMNKMKIPHRGTPHVYPRIQMTHLLVLAYWKSIDHVAYQMMQNNMASVSEDLGELSFSMLARCVLGDHIKSDIVHMDQLYKLLPVYRSIKKDIGDDTNNKDAMSWHHTIQPDAVEIHAVAFFFNRMIGEVLSNTFRSYSGESAGYKSRNAAAEHLTEDFLPPVYIDNYDDLDIHDILRSIPTALEGFFLQDHQHIWPNREAAPFILDDDPNDSMSGHEEGDDDGQEQADEQKDESTRDLGFVCADWSHCRVARYAVVHFKYGEGETYHSGIQVYRVDSIDPPVQPGIESYYNTFQGRQLLPTIASTQEACIRGRWHLHPANSRGPAETVIGYSVIQYFDKLDKGNLTPEIKQTLRQMHTRLTLFEDNRH